MIQYWQLYPPVIAAVFAMAVLVVIRRRDLRSVMLAMAIASVPALQFALTYVHQTAGWDRFFIYLIPTSIIAAAFAASVVRRPWVYALTACVLLAGGAPGQRFSLPNPRIMMHQPSGGFQGQAADIQIQAQEILRLRRTIDQILAHHTGKPVEQITRDSDRDFYMSPQEALEYGLIDHILTPQKGAVATAVPNGKAASEAPAAEAEPAAR